MHLSQDKLCTRKMEHALEVKFISTFTEFTRPWWRTLINGSDVKYVFPRCRRDLNWFSTYIQHQGEEEGTKPWQNGTPNSSQLEPSFQLGWSWVSFGQPLGSRWMELDRVGMNLIKLKFSPNSSQVFHRLATSANSSQVVLLLLGVCAVVVRQLNGFLANWVDLAVSFGHLPMQVLICNLARVGLSWEYRLRKQTQKRSKITKNNYGGN